MSEKRRARVISKKAQVFLSANQITFYGDENEMKFKNGTALMSGYKDFIFDPLFMFRTIAAPSVGGVDYASMPKKK